ncbi:MAG: hypothetical protein R3C15_00790 [Thermoleophilia bacterium]
MGLGDGDGLGPGDGEGLGLGDGEGEGELVGPGAVPAGQRAVAATIVDQREQLPAASRARTARR